MFIRCIISPKKIGMCLTEVKFVKISSFSENINHDRTTFSLADSPFSPFLPPLKWNGGPSWIDITFNVHWGILGAILSTSLIPTLIFNSIFVLKSWLSCFRGTATYTKIDTNWHTSPICWHDIYNTNVYISWHTSPNPGPEGYTDT